MVGTKKSQDRAGNVIGQEAAKLRQLRILGYTPIVIPFSAQSNFSTVMKTMATLMKSIDSFDLNLDDGYRKKY